MVIDNLHTLKLIETIVSGKSEGNLLRIALTLLLVQLLRQLRFRFRGSCGRTFPVHERERALHAFVFILAFGGSEDVEAKFAPHRVALGKIVRQVMKYPGGLLVFDAAADVLTQPPFSTDGFTLILESSIPDAPDL